MRIPNTDFFQNFMKRRGQIKIFSRRFATLILEEKFIHIEYLHEGDEWRQRHH
jgi:hypothetical protein